MQILRFFVNKYISQLFPIMNQFIYDIHIYYLFFRICAEKINYTINFGRPAQTLTQYKFLHVKNNFATVVNDLSVLKLFQLSNGDLFFS